MYTILSYVGLLLFLLCYIHYIIIVFNNACTKYQGTVHSSIYRYLVYNIIMYIIIFFHFFFHHTTTTRRRRRVGLNIIEKKQKKKKIMDTTPAIKYKINKIIEKKKNKYLYNTYLLLQNILNT